MRNTHIALITSLALAGAVGACGSEERPPTIPPTAETKLEAQQQCDAAQAGELIVPASRMIDYGAIRIDVPPAGDDGNDLICVGVEFEEDDG